MPTGSEMSASPRRAATITDVAGLAGVSKSTVSNVVRRSAAVSEQTRERVLNAIEQLDYRPNAIARQFVQQRSTLLGVLVGDLDNPYYAELAKLVERVTFERGFSSLFSNIEGDPELAVAAVEALLEQRVAGIVFLSLLGQSPQIERLLHNRLPVALIGLHDNWCDSAAPDDEQGGRLATDHLIGLGHRRVAFVTTPAVEARCEAARYRGCAEALSAAGLPSPAVLRWEPGADTLRTGDRELPIEVALGSADAPTAAFVSNDTGAIALLEALDARAIDVPRQLSVVGFDDVSLAGLRRISLTTVAQPTQALVASGIGLLTDAIAATPPSAPRHVTLPVRIEPRGSTGAPRS